MSRHENECVLALRLNDSLLMRIILHSAVFTFHASLFAFHFSSVSAHQRRDLRLRYRSSDLKLVAHDGDFQII